MAKKMNLMTLEMEIVTNRPPPDAAFCSLWAAFVVPTDGHYNNRLCLHQKVHRVAGLCCWRSFWSNTFVFQIDFSGN